MDAATGNFFSNIAGIESWLLGGIVLLCIFRILAIKFNLDPRGKENSQYELIPKLFSNAERSFYGVLERAVGVDSQCGRVLSQDHDLVSQNMLLSGARRNRGMHLLCGLYFYQ